ncbi:helix-turn-helix transcriptional regulator [Zooshikella harenae]|uniref:YafY family transcriptional regulator n=1 Tax=Zooshikella harenae TaxID=2827238 RepID=A0ABS5ZK42_9GAMM|nr:YafY family protein [Zooshikella harenae]MBU2714183.1 YafY family transcriptional regulator [Zooshikella harenae]
MRRADRLVQILLLLRGRRRTTAQQLAEWLEVSPRTIYRDMADLMMSGAPVNGEAGEGYWLERGFTPPPVKFTANELAALEVGARMLAARADKETADAAKSALAKIHATLGSTDLPIPPLYAPPMYSYPLERLTPIRSAIEKNLGLWIEYKDLQDNTSQRLIWPVGLVFWGDRWTLTAWCNLRKDYRTFRVDLLQKWEMSEEKSPPNISMQDYLLKSGADQETLAAFDRIHKQPWHSQDDSL